MNTFTSPSTIAGGRAARHSMRRAADWLRTRWRHGGLDASTRYLSRASDHADLERRMRALERCTCRPPC
jgi:hypothetical protein